MKFCIDIRPSQFLITPDEYLNTWKKSGIDMVQLFVAHQAWLESVDATVKARDIIRAAGFECTLISVPVGHPGSKPTDEQLKTMLMPGWRFRTARNGEPQYTSVEPTDKMISDVMAYCRDFASLGFDTFFMDDDLRIGNLSPDVSGCFCDECLAGFSAREGKSFTRESLLASDEKTLERWCLFQSERITRFMTELSKIVAKPGIMIMNSGDERHGIAVRDIANIPGIQVRVGEEHFFDHSAASLQGRLDNFIAVTGHLYRLGGKAETYSETTVLNGKAFGYKTTTPLHTISKAYLALTAGVDNIDWMCDKYYDTFAEYYKELRSYHAETCGERSYPVHVARDGFAAGFGIYPDTTATAAGLPAAPVFVSEAAGGELLVMPDHLWERDDWKKAAEKYNKVVKPSELADTLKTIEVPHAESTAPLCLSYIPSRHRVALYNPLEEEQTAEVCGKSIKLAAGGAGWLDI